MSVAERDFSTFELGDNVYELADGLIPEIAERLDFELGPEPDSNELFGLVGKLGKNKVLRANKEVTAIDLNDAAVLLDRSGVQLALDRSLWTPQIQAGSTGITVATGAVANWQDRTAHLIAASIEAEKTGKEVHVVTGNRVMGKLESERNNPNVKAFHENEGSYPTETQYATEFVLPVIRRAGGDVTLTSYHTDKGERLAANFVREANFSADPEVTKTMFQDGSPVTFARVANAGIQLAVQFRDAVRSYSSPDFDRYPHLPEAFVLTDEFPIARTEEEKADPVNFQSPYTGLRQAVLTAKMLHEASQDL